MSTKQSAALASARLLGIKGLSKDAPVDEIYKRISEVLGEPDSGNDDQVSNESLTDSYINTINRGGEDAVASKTGAVVGGDLNIPNLSPTGKWEGKRARIRRMKTGQNDMAGAMFNWNGWVTIIPIGQEVDVAWPIYEATKNCDGIELSIRQVQDPENRGRVQNIQEKTFYEKYPISFIEVTPGTEHLPESPWEYTLDMYVEDFPGYTVRKWRQLCILWEISDAEAGIEAGISPDEEATKRRNAVHFKLNLPLPEKADRQIRERIRAEKRHDIGMDKRAA